MKRTTSLILYIFLLFVSCQSDLPDEQPILSVDQESIDYIAFKSRVETNLQHIYASSEELWFKHLGNPRVSESIFLKDLQESKVAFIPVFTKRSEHTEAVIIAVESEHRTRYTLIERGNLYTLEYSQSENAPTIIDHAYLFVMLDQKVFGLPDYKLSEIIGYKQPNSDGLKSTVNLNTEGVDNHTIPFEWVDIEECHHMYFTDFEGVTTYTGYECYVVGSYWSETGTAGSSVILDQGAGGGGGSYTPTTSASWLHHNQTTFAIKDYTKISNNERTSHLLNFIRYSRKNSINVDLSKIFTNIPSGTSGFASAGWPFDTFRGSIILGGNIIEVTLLEFPLDTDYHVFSSSIADSPDVYPNNIHHVNFVFNRDCGGCTIPLRSLLIQVKATDYQKIRNFLDGK